MCSFEVYIFYYKATTPSFKVYIFHYKATTPHLEVQESEPPPWRFTPVTAALALSPRCCGTAVQRHGTTTWRNPSGT